MRTTVLGLLLGAGFVVSVVAIISQQSPVFAQRPAVPRPEHVAKDDQLIAFSVAAAEGRQQITIIDPKTRSMCVYHIELATGEIALKSVRRIHWDLQMETFNGASPSPRDIRALIEQR
jgi:hypothetical protein